MGLKRESGTYLIVGGLQWLLDWTVMVLLSQSGIPIRHANVAGRVCGALLGFWLNGRFTFTGEKHVLGAAQLRRFGVMWILTTILSTWAIGHIDDYLGRHWAWLAKPLVEIALGVAGFVVSRYWVYRR